MKTKEDNKCPHETIGRGMIEHDGIKHAGGPQICLNCRMTMEEILEASYERGREDVIQTILNEVALFKEPDRTEFTKFIKLLLKSNPPKHE